MSKTTLFAPIFALFAVLPAACDEVDDGSPERVELAVDEAQDDADAQDDMRAEADAPEHDESLDPAELDSVSEPAAFEGPPGTICCVDCGDNLSYLHDLGTAEGCNTRGAQFCHSHGWYFINAEWLPGC